MRLIGIDTAETKRPGVAVECGGKAATAVMHQWHFGGRAAGGENDKLTLAPARG